MSEPKEMQRTVGAAGAAVTIVGLVIGISIFILPGTLAATTGPAVTLSYGLASLMALFTCVVAAQVGAAFPVSGASFVAVSRLLSPVWGFTIVWMLLGGAAVAVALLGFGFADYLQLVWPSVDRQATAILLVLGLGGLNLLGVRDTVIGQTLMVAVFMVALAVFCIAGLVNLNADLLTPFMPNGMKPVLAATIPAFFSYAGFIIIPEIAGEIRNPGRNLPLALAISFVAVLVVYQIVSVAVVGLIPWEQLGEVNAPVGEAAALVLPRPVATAITLTAVAAAASSVNVLLLGPSRDVLALARVKVFPEVMAKLSKKHGEPVRGVVFMTVLSLICAAFGRGITEYATLAVLGLLVFQVVVGAAILFLPRKLGSLYERAGFKLGRFALPFFGGGLVILSLIFLVIAIQGSPRTGLVAGSYMTAGLAYYAWRRSYLRKRDVYVDANIRQEVEAVSQERLER